MKGTALRLGVIVAVPMCLFAPYLFGNMTFLPSDLNSMTLPWRMEAGMGSRVQNHYLSDTLVEHYPWKVLIGNELRSGRIPLWNPFNYLGLPLLAGSTPGVTDPFSLLLVFVAPPAAFHWIVALQFIVAGLGFYWLLQTSGVGPRGALFGSLAYQLNGQFIVLCAFQWMPGAFAWLPFAMGAWEKAKEGERPWWYGIAGLALGASALSANVQIVLAAFLAWALYLLGRGVAQYRVGDRAAFVRALSYGGVVLGIAVGVGAIHLIPVGELIWYSWGARHFDLAAWFADFPRRFALLGFLPVFAIPYLVWSPQSLDVLKALGTAADYFNGFIGIIPAAFALTGAYYGRGVAATSGRWLAMGALLMALLTPVGLYLYFRMLIIYIFGASILAAIGLDLVLSKSWREEFRSRVFSGLSRLVAIGLVAVVLIVGTLMLVFRFFAVPIQRHGEQFVRGQLAHSTSRYSSFADFYLDRVPATWGHYAGPGMSLRVSLGVFAAFWLVLWLWKGRLSWAGPAFAGILLLTAADLSFYFWQYVPRVSMREYPLYPPSPSMQFLMKQSGLFRILVLLDFRKDPPILPLEANIPYQLYNVHGWGSLPTLETRLFYEAVGLRDVDRESNVPLSPEVRMVADALNVRFLLAAPGTVLDLEDVALVYRGEIWIYENQRAYSRAYAVGGYALVASSGTARDRLREDPAGGTSRILLEAGGRQDLPILWPRQAAPPKGVRIVSYEPARVRLETEGPEASLVVLSDAYYPGWYARVDGEPAPVFRANGVVRAVFVPSGKRSVEFWFDPPSVRAGFFVSAAACIAALVWTAFCRILDRRRRMFTKNPF